MQVTETKGPETKIPSLQSVIATNKRVSFVSVENKPRFLSKEVLCDIASTWATHSPNAVGITRGQRPGGGWLRHDAVREEEQGPSPASVR